MTIVLEASRFAECAHAAVGQVRKYTGEPYIVHPREVASIIIMNGSYDDATVAAALLHDVVEDTKVSIRMIHRYFGREVAGLVYEVTDQSRPEDGNRAARKKIDRFNLSQASERAQTIKLADLISNTKSIVAYDPDFARVYIPEKIKLLTVMTKGDKELYRQALELAEQSIAALGMKVELT